MLRNSTSDLHDLPAAPSALLDDERGGVALGRYLGLVKDLSTDHWDGSLGLSSARRIKRKTWVFMGAFSPRFMVGFAVVDAGLLGTAFAYVFDREQRKLWEDKITVPLGFARDFKGRLDAPWELSRGPHRFRIVPHADGLQAEFNRAGPAPFGLKLRARKSGPGMSTIAPSSGSRPFNLTYKDCDLVHEVELQLGDQRHQLAAPGMLDFTLGYPPRRTSWNWAAGNGNAGGARIGFNLVAHFNEGLENALWIHGRIVALAQAKFAYDPKALDKPWRVTTDDGVFEALFEPEGQRGDNIQAVLLGSKFVQLFGRFTGSVAVEGARQNFTAFGVVEEHHALW